MIGISACIILAGFIGIWQFISFINQDHKTVMLTEDKTIVEELEAENKKLRSLITGILPKENKLLYEQPYRLYYKTFADPTVPIHDVLSKGRGVAFNNDYTDECYKRPMYNSGWRDFYFRGWLDIDAKVEDAHHRLFVFLYGGSSNFDFGGNQGIGELGVVVDYHRYINFLIYNFHVTDVKVFKNQVAIVGEPRRQGIEVVSILQDHLLEEGVDKKHLLFQLSTPKGYGIDDIVYQVYNYEYLMEEIRKHTVRQTFISISVDKTVQELEQDNRDLRKDLSYYIPLEEDVIITDQNCRLTINQRLANNINKLSIVKDHGTPIQHQRVYQNPEFQRPTYNPLWKKHLQEGWAYIPTKICENSHNLFVLPSNVTERQSFLQKQSLHDPIELSDQGTYILMFNFTPQEIIQYKEQIIILGTPSRTGAHIISLHIEGIKKYPSYLIQLVTPDLYEIDYTILHTYGEQPSQKTPM